MQGFPLILGNLHHHCWDFWEERGQDGGREGVKEREQRQRGEEGVALETGEGGCVQGRGVGRWQRQKKGGRKKRRERKLRQDSCLPGYPHLFIDLGMIERNWAAAWQQKSAWWLHCSGDPRLKVAHGHYFRCLKTSVNLWLYFLFIRIWESVHAMMMMFILEN